MASYADLLFYGGWWTFGTWIAIGLSALVTALLVRARSDLFVLAAVMLGPFAAIFVFLILKDLADPEPGCSGDCEGRIALVGPPVGTFIGWLSALVVGSVQRISRDRRRRE